MAERISNGSAGGNDDQQEDGESEQEAKCDTGENGPLGHPIADLEGLGSDPDSISEEALARAHEGGAWFNDDEQEGSELDQEAKCGTGENGPLLVVGLEGLGSDLDSLSKEALARAHEGDAWFMDRLRRMARLALRMVRVASRISHLLEMEADALNGMDEDRAQDVRRYAEAMRERLDNALKRLRACRTWQTIPSHECERRARHQCRIIVGLAIAGGTAAWLN